MPNHIRNMWEIKNIPQDQIQYLLDKLTIVVKSHDDGDVEINERIIDFDLIVPEPRLKRDCPKKFIVNKKSHIQEDVSRPWFNWYDWRIEHWNTKWGAYDGYTIVGKTYIKFIFSTAWSFARPVALALGEQLNYNLIIKYADEALGHNCGWLEYDASEHEWTEYNSTSMSSFKNPTQFAKRLWETY